jgi:hypothetical protein
MAPLLSTNDPDLRSIRTIKRVFVTYGCMKSAAQKVVKGRRTPVRPAVVAVAGRRNGEHSRREGTLNGELLLKVILIIG